MKILLIVLTSTLFAFASGLVYMANSNAKLKNKLFQAELHLEVQNKKIETMRLESEKYHCDLESMNAYTRDKYKHIVDERDLTTCESKLKEFEKALGIYGGGE